MIKSWQNVDVIEREFDDNGADIIAELVAAELATLDHKGRVLVSPRIGAELDAAELAELELLTRRELNFSE